MNVPTAAARTVVIEGGLFSFPGAYRHMEQALVARGFDVVVAKVGGLGFQSVQRDAAHLGEAVEAAAARSLARGGDGRVSVVAHSKGGISARWYLQRMGGFEHVDQLLTLGTPHQGARPLGVRLSALAARYLGIRPVADMVADGPLMRGLVADLPADMAAARATHADARIVSIASDVGRWPVRGSDGFIKVSEARVAPAGVADARSGAALLGFEDVMVRGMGHNALGGRLFGSLDPVMDVVVDKLRRTS